MSDTSRRSRLALVVAGSAVAVANAARAAPAPGTRSTRTRPGEGLVALITGSARGIGAATAKRLAAEGNAIRVNCLTSRDLAEQVVQDIEAGGGRAIVHQADVMDPGTGAAVFDAKDPAFGVSTDVRVPPPTRDAPGAPGTRPHDPCPLTCDLAGVAGIAQHADGASPLR